MSNQLTREEKAELIFNSLKENQLFFYLGKDYISVNRLLKVDDYYIYYDHIAYDLSSDRIIKIQRNHSKSWFDNNKKSEIIISSYDEFEKFALDFISSYKTFQ